MGFKSMPIGFGVSIDAGAQAWFNACATAGSAVSGADQGYVNTFFQTMRSKGLLAITDRMWNLASATATQALIDMSALTTATLSIAAQPTFAAYGGYTGNGTTTYIDSVYNPSTQGVHYTQNSAAYGAYVRTARVAGQNYAEIGNSGSTTALWPWFSDNNLYSDINNTGDITNTNIGVVKGMWLVSRTSSSHVDGYHNSTSFTSSTNTSTAPVNTNFFILGSNNGSGSLVYSTADQVAFAWIGGSLTSQQATDLTNAINTLATSQGWNVF